MTKFGRFSKEKMIDELVRRFESKPNFIVANFSKLGTSELDKLRSNLKKVKSDYIVVKNSITKQTLKKLKLKNTDNLFEKSCGVIFSGPDVPASAKCAVTFAKDHGDIFEIKGGFIDGDVVGNSVIKELSLLPPKEVLLSKLFGTMKSPVSGLVNVLSGTIRSLVYAVEALRQKKEKSST